MKKLSLITLILLLAISMQSQIVNFNRLDSVSIFSNSIISSERVIIMEGDIIGNMEQAILLHASELITSNEVIDNIESDLQSLQSTLNSFEGIEANAEYSNTSITPNIYEISGNTNFTGVINLTGDSNDVYIFNIDGNLNFNDFTLISSFEVNPKNVIWNVSGQVYAGVNTEVFGVFVANDDISFENHNSGSVSLFSLSGDVKISTLLNIQSPEAHLSKNSQLSASFDCSPELAQGSGLSCSQAEDAPFFDPNNWKVNQNFNQNTPLIEVAVNFHILSNNSGTTNYQENTNDTLSLLQNFDWAQSLIRYPRVPTDPQTSICGSCHVSDSRIQLVLKNIEYYYDDSQENILGPSTTTRNMVINRLPDTRNSINVFWSMGSFGASGSANWPLTLKGSTNNYFQYIMMYQNYTPYNPNNTYQGNYATAITIAHEVGHNLDQRHTYSGGGASAECNSQSLYYLDDVHGTGTNKICPHNPSPSNWGCDASSSNNDNCTNNLMAGNFNSQYLSPKQIGIAHTTLRLTSMRRTISNCPYSSTPLTISSSATWNKDLHIFRDIVVDSGATLTVQCKLGMPEAGRIIVNKGGSLIIDGAKIYSNCKNSFWQGIELEGNDSLPQYAQPGGQIYQPYVSIQNGGEISNAKVAVRTGITDSNGNFVNGTAGGFIIGTDAIFKNNLTDIIMHPYQNYTSGNPQNLRKDMSYCYRCSFISDTPLPDNLITAEHININGIDGLNLEGCIFKNELVQSNLVDRGTAIRSLNSSYEMIPNGTTRTLVEGFYLGIDNYASNPMYTPTIKKTDFINNVKGMLVAGSDYATIIQNKFEVLDAGSSHEPYGLYLNWSSGYEVEENNFKYTGGGTATNAVGLVVMNSNNNVNEIYRNNFDHLQVGTLIHGYNKLSGTSEGLVIKCNDYDADAFHIALESINQAPFGGYLHPEIAQNQGGNANKTDPAGNTFNDLCNSGGASDIFISTNGSSINYFHHADAITTPLCRTTSKVSNVATTYQYQSREESCPSNISGGGGTDPGVEPGFGFVSYSGNDFNETLKKQLSNKTAEIEALKLNDYIRLKLLQDTIEIDSVILALAASGNSNNQIRMIAAMVRKGDTSFSDKSVQNLLSKEALDYIAFSNELNSGGKHFEEAKKSFNNSYFMWARVREHQLSGEKVPSAYQLPQKRIRSADENNQRSTITVFPNPTDEQLTIELESFEEEDEIQLDILDVKGSLIKSVPLNSIKQKLSVAELKNGMYLLNIHKNGKLMATERFNVQH